MVHQDPRVSWVHRVNREILDQQDQLVWWDLVVSSDLPARRVNLGRTESQDQPDLRVQPDAGVYRACQVYLDPRVTEDFLVWTAPKEKWEDLA